MSKGAALALLTVTLWALYNVFARYSMSLDVNPAIFVTIGFIAASVVLLVIAGPGPLGIATLRQPATWAYSLFSLIEHIITLYLFVYVTSTEGSLMQRLNVIVALVLALIIFNRAPRWQGLAGSAVILAGVGLIIANLESETKTLALLFLGGAVLAQTIKTFLAEVHPTSNAADTIKKRCRVTAFVSFVTSLVFLMLIGTLSWVRSTTPGAEDIVLLAAMPTLDDFLSPTTFILAVAFGVVLEALSIYSYFYAVRLIKSEAFFAVAALVPVLTYGFEWAAAQFGLVSIRALTNADLLAGGLIVAGSVVMMVNTRWKNK